ncbi:MAG: rhomboid family intramembrane serine protease, partial [Candidatus Omnitrophica bacterium]|nr:rhomboid family intramembrane serine protease [Candidatus Omnitrophota bacterium]
MCKRFPVVTLSLIVVNSLVFIYETLLLPDRIGVFINTYGFIPERIFQPVGLFEKIVPVFSSMFLHSDIFHLVGNMLYLWIFGCNVEDRLGRFKILVFYVLTGIIAGFVDFITGMHSLIPSIGASGAIS